MIQMLNMDCEEFMTTQKDKSFDLAIVDPPYMAKWKQAFAPGSGVSTIGVLRNRQQFKHWSPPGKPYFDQLYRVSKHQIIWGCNYYEQHIPFPGRLIWDKLNDSSSFSKAEIAASDLLYGVQMFRFQWAGMLQHDMKHKEKRIHATQKPVALYKWQLMKYAKPEWRVLDTHGGSGSICIAAYDLGFDLVWMEKDPDIYEAAVERFEEHKRKPSVFEPEDIQTVRRDLFQ